MPPGRPTAVGEIDAQNQHSEPQQTCFKPGLELAGALCLALIALLAFSPWIARICDTSLLFAVTQQSVAKNNHEAAKAQREDYITESERALAVATKAFEDTDADRAKVDIYSANQPETIANARHWTKIARQHLAEQQVRIDDIRALKDDKSKRLNANEAAASNYLSAAEATIDWITRGIVQTGWIIKAFVFEAGGTAALTIFNLFVARARRPVSEDPLAVCLMKAAGGIIGVMAVSYTGSIYGYFEDIATNINHQLRVLSIAIAAGLSWDILVRSTRLAFERFSRGTEHASQSSAPP